MALSNRQNMFFSSNLSQLRCTCFMTPPRLLSLVTLLSACLPSTLCAEENKLEVRGGRGDAPAGVRASAEAASAERREGARGERAPVASRLQLMRERLGLSADQMAQLEPLFAEESARTQAVRSDSALSEEARRLKMDEIRSAVRDKIASVLTPEQKAKFGEEAMRQRAVRPGGADNDRLVLEIKEKLALTDEQTAKLRTILTESVARSAVPRPERQAGGGERGGEGRPSEGGAGRERVREGGRGPGAAPQ